MNNMKSKENGTRHDRDLQKLSHSIGNFIRYWGFRKIHGSIWTQLYLSKTSLSCTELTQRLGVSKALVSPALEELKGYKLIHEAPAPNEKTKVYYAAENISEVIRHVLKTRESKMLKQITEDFAAFNKSKSHRSDLNGKRIESLEGMILSANMMLEIMLSQKDLLNLPSEFEK